MTPKCDLSIITSLPSAEFTVVRPIEVEVRQVGEEGDNFVANVKETRLAASGESVADAMDMLGQLIIAKFEIFENEPLHQLGPEPRRQSLLLTSSIQRTR